MKQRDQVSMTTAEVAEFLAAGRKVQLGTNGADGYPHLVTMYYVLVDSQITFWTYKSSQKALNLERDGRISALVETGEQYFDLRGVLIQGVARRIEDPAAIAAIGRRITSGLAGPGAGADDAALAQYVEHAVRKRFGYAIEPRRTISWDHAKLLPPAGAD